MAAWFSDALDGTTMTQVVNQAVGPENPNHLKCLTFVPVMITLAQPIFP
jgi:hypothetical protein